MFRCKNLQDLQAIQRRTLKHQKIKTVDRLTDIIDITPNSNPETFDFPLPSR